MSTLSQRSFAAGEVTPAIYARPDQVKYTSGLRVCRNFIVQRHGGAASRPGTVFDAEVKDSTTVVRLIPFVFNSAQTFVLEFGNQYMRVHQAGAQVTETAKAITGITKTAHGIITVVGHGLTAGDEIYVSGVVGMTEMNGRNFKVAVVIDPNSFTFYDMGGTYVTTSSYTTYVSGGTIARVYTVATPYLATDLAALKFVESADVITITHPSYDVYELSRVSNTSWTFAIAAFAPATVTPHVGIAAGTGGVGTTVYYKCTAVGANGEESLPGGDNNAPISSITLGASILITCNVSLYALTVQNGDEVFLSNISGTKELNGKVFIVADLSLNTFRLKDVTGAYIDGSAYTAYVSGGKIDRQTMPLSSGGAATTGAPNVITFDAQLGVKVYNVYKSVNGIFGFIGSAYNKGGGGAITYSDTGATPDTTDVPPYFTHPFPSTGDSPSCVGFFQQRRTFGGSNNKPEQVQASKTGSFKNFTINTPLRDDDAITFTLAGRQVNAVKHLIELGTPLVFTQAGEWSLAGDAGGALTATGGVGPKQHSYCGASDLQPIIVDSTAIFVQARGNRVRDLFFDWQVNGYRGNDLSIFSSHLFEGYSIVDWTFSQIPNSIIWAVRSDGKLLGLTYVREQQLWGWHRHDFDGTVENVCAVPEGGEDYLYLVIKRIVNGRSVRYIERMSTRSIGNVVDYIGMDASLSYDGRNTDSTKTMTLSGGTNWVYTESLTLTANASQFLSTDVGNGVNLTGSDGTIIRCTITGYSSATVVTVTPNKTVPSSMRSVALSTWAKAIKTINGLWHIEAKSISVLGDGFVVASPNNPDDTAVTVATGRATLDKPYAVIHAGLPYICDLETLDPDVTQGETLSDKNKCVGKVNVSVENSRGLWAGGQLPDETVSSVEGLDELKIRGEDGENQDAPISLATETVDIIIRPEWNNNGRVFLRQIDPVPLTVLAIMPAGYFPIRS